MGTIEPTLNLMSDDHTLPMIVATSALRQRRHRVGELMGVTLPRSVDLITLFIVAGFSLVGRIIGAGLIGGFNGILYSTVVAGVLGWIAATYQPVQDISVYRWLRLRMGLRKRRQIPGPDGKPVALYVGVAFIKDHKGFENLQQQRVNTFYYLPGAIEVSEANQHLVGLTPTRRHKAKTGAPVPLQSRPPRGATLSTDTHKDSPYDHSA